MRLRAIAFAAFYSIAPYWLYEDSPHYSPMSYWEHMWLNIKYGSRWLIGHENEDDIEFERSVNG